MPIEFTPVYDTQRQAEIHQKSLSSLSQQIESFWDKPDTKDELLEILADFRNWLEEQYSNRSPLFVVGGKSRRVVEVLVSAALKESSPHLQHAWENRLRLNQAENTPISHQATPELPPRLILEYGLTQSPVIFVEETLNVGKKANSVLQGFEDHHIDGEFYALVESNFSPHMRERYKYFPENPTSKKPITGRYRQNAFGYLKALSRLHSDVIGVRLEKSIRTLSGSQIPLDQFTLTPEHQQLISTVQNYFQQLEMFLDQDLATPSL